MSGKLALATTISLLTASSSFALVVVRSDFSPTDPGPNIVYNTGGTCHTAWNGDNSSPAWKDMKIQLMTGSNTNMVALQTVATGLDGTTSGSFDHTCPSVSSNSAIYFYQYSAAKADGYRWTTRFTIASVDGKTTTPDNQAQPDGSPVQWGSGSILPDNATATTNSNSNNSKTPSSSSSASASPSVTPLSAPNAKPAEHTSSSSSSNNKNTSSTPKNGTFPSASSPPKAVASAFSASFPTASSSKPTAASSGTTAPNSASTSRLLLVHRIAIFTTVVLSALAMTPF